MAKAELDASDKKADFDSQIAKSVLDAGDMKVSPLQALWSTLLLLLPMATFSSPYIITYSFPAL